MSSKKNPTKYRGKELEYIEAVLNSENWSSVAGSWNQVMEQYLADKFGVKHAVAFNSGTSTLHAALEACQCRVACGAGAGKTVDAGGVADDRQQRIPRYARGLRTLEER